MQCQPGGTKVFKIVEAIKKRLYAQFNIYIQSKIKKKEQVNVYSDASNKLSDQDFHSICQLTIYFVDLSKTLYYNRLYIIYVVNSNMLY